MGFAVIACFFIIHTTFKYSIAWIRRRNAGASDSVIFPEANITCVDIDKEHIKIARRFFKIPKKNVTVIEGDAYSVLRASKKRYDWIIDDVFQHVSGEPERDGKAYQLLKTYQNNLSKNGLLSLNIIGKRQQENIHPLMEGFDRVIQFIHPLYENRIIAMLNNADDQFFQKP